MDATVQVAAIGVLATVITTVGVVVAAALNARRRDSGDRDVVAVLLERIALRDKVIAELRAELQARNGHHHHAWPDGPRAGPPE
jgi:hypothetical protein